jgi:hypothetical protein
LGNFAPDDGRWLIANGKITAIGFGFSLFFEEFRGLNSTSQVLQLLRFFTKKQIFSSIVSMDNRRKVEKLKTGLDTSGR